MNWDSDIMYWTVNPQHKLIFQEVYKGDNSRDKKKSSCLMWGIALVYHVDSEMYDLTFEEKINHVKKFIWKDYSKEFLVRMKELSERMGKIDGGDTPGMRQLKQWNRIMDQKSTLLSTMEYNATTWENLERMLGSNGKMFDEYERILKILQKESSVEERTKGRSTESLLEQSKI